MRINPMPLESRISEGADYEVLLDHTDLTTATTGTAQVFNVPAKANQSFELKRSILDVPFQNSSSTANNTTPVIVGDGSTTNLFLTTQETNQNGSFVPRADGTGTKKWYTATGNAVITVTPMTGTNLAQIDTGRMRFQFKIVDESAVGPAPA